MVVMNIILLYAQILKILVILILLLRFRAFDNIDLFGIYELIALWC